MNVLRPLAIVVTIVALVLHLAVSCVATPVRPAPSPRPTPAPTQTPREPDGTSVAEEERVPIPDAPPPDDVAGPGPTVPVTPPPPSSVGTAPQRDPPHVRVVLSSVTKAGRAPIEISGAWTIRTLDGSAIRTGSGLRGEIVVSAADLRAGPYPLPADGATIEPAVDGDLRVGTKRYPGALRVARGTSGRMTAHVEVDVETYLEGVVAGELPPEFPREAMRAQAVLARTYLLTQPGVAWDAPVIQVDDTGLTDQEFAGIAANAKFRDAIRDAVRSTRGFTVFSGDRPLRTWYHSICGGHTTDAAPVFGVPRSAPLSGVACDGCVGSRYYRWKATIPGAKVVEAAKLTGALQSFRVSATAAEGRATEFEIRAGNRTAKVRAADFRLAVGPSLLRSVWIDTAAVAGADLAVTGRGWGHGVGLCQWGAKGLAERRLTGESIVAHYYPGAVVRRLW